MALENKCVIIETLKNIDQKQKESIVEEGCISCESSLIASKYNTIPISIYLCCGNLFNAALGPFGEDTARLFRVEEVIDCETVKLRLIEEIEGSIEDDCSKKRYKCTNQTCLLSIDCCCCIQCFRPINCKSCSI